MEIALTICNLIVAGASVCGLIFSLFCWILNQKKQTEDIRQLKEENTIICYGLSACLDGLIQLGTNGDTHKAKEDLEKYLNKSAHK